MSKPLIALRNKISRQAYEVPADEADQILAHPVWGKINEVVRTAKPEVLHAPPSDASDEKVTVQKGETIVAKKDVITFGDKANSKKDDA